MPDKDGRGLCQQFLGGFPQSCGSGGISRTNEDWWVSVVRVVTVIGWVGAFGGDLGGFRGNEVRAVVRYDGNEVACGCVGVPVGECASLVLRLAHYGTLGS